MSKPTDDEVIPPTLKPLLGRYVYRDETSNKFWEIIFLKDSGMYQATWGKLMHAPQGTKDYTGREALKKIQEKIAKGYHLDSDTLRPKRKDADPDKAKAMEAAWEAVKNRRIPVTQKPNPQIEDEMTWEEALESMVEKK